MANQLTVTQGWAEPARRRNAARNSPGTLYWLLTNGVVRRGMPVWSKLPEPKRLATRKLPQELKRASQTCDAARKP